MKKRKKSSKTRVKKTTSKKFYDNAGRRLFFIGGPCVIENEKMAVETAKKLAAITKELGIPFIFKASYDKANRTSVKSYRGPGADRGLKILAKIKKQLKIPVLTDVHSPAEAVKAGKTADILQIPAFLCRQTDLITAAAKTGKAINIKKGQFLSPGEVNNIVVKAKKTGAKKIFLTERGYSFGYNNLVVDMKSIASMKKTGWPVIIDATHAVQRPGGAGNRSTGDRKFVETIARAAVAAGADGVFMEVHPNPKKALSDKDIQVPLKRVKKILEKLKRIYEAVN